ncbi:MAG: 16S rRNA (guanine(527)-N(7))-methyltransferase RsmG [Ruminococcus sp.]|nr:16S rRNA (guanine(527)-N(7))-methyltransferase RsmG [Ruminococcus sp.]
MLPEFEICCSLFNKYDIVLNREKYDLLSLYAELLVDWNNKINLTAITAPEEILVKHFLDSILVLKYFDIPENSSLIDVGTGAGFPSVPIKIFRPDIKLTLLDSLAKRIGFLENLCSNLNICANFVHGRAEDIARQSAFREQFDISCARAVAGLPVLSEFCIPFVKQGGTFISMKGQNEDIEPAKNAVALLGGTVSDVYDYNLEVDARRIIIIKKISQTSTKYPRNSAQIKKKSL